MQDIRSRLIEATFQEVFENGYNGASLTKILKRANTQKGSMYHHFSSKKDMVINMIEEKIETRIETKWEALKNQDEDILDLLIEILEDKNSWDLVNGCPLGNLLQESLNQDKDFAEILTTILKKWKDVFNKALEKAKKNGELKKEIESEKISTFLIASLEGALLLSKKSSEKEDFDYCIEQLVFYINTLKNNN